LNLYRRTSQLALETTLLLALEPDGSSRRIRELAEELGVAPTYLTKIVQNLTRVGLLRAMRGPGGGVQLARPAREIYPWQVLEAVEPAGEFTRCLLGTRPCTGEAPCPLHEVWAPTRDKIREILQTKNLREFAAEAQRTGAPFWLPVEGGNGRGSGRHPQGQPKVVSDED
jgi:Rrf2 family protein